MNNTILLVDENPKVRFLLRNYLQQIGFVVVEAKHGLAAINQLSRHNVCAAIVDYRMPIMNGAALVRHWQEQGVSFPMVMLTTSQDSQFKKDVQGLPLQAILAKPVDFAVLSDVVSHWYRAAQQAS